MTAIYDRIGLTYADLRKADPRIERLIRNALGAAQTVLNVGRGRVPTNPPIDRSPPSSHRLR